MTKAGFSIADIERQTATDEAVELQPFLPNGDLSGITLLVKSEQAPSVVAAINAINDAWKRKSQIADAKARVSRPGEVITSNEDEADHVRRLVAVRLAGWRGLDDEFSQENAIRLLKVMPSFVSQVLIKSAELGSFTKPLSES